jgi:hypothetical protein
VRETYRASDQIRAAPVRAKAPIPIKVRLAVLHGGANVTQPQRAKRIVAQQVFAENSEMVFGAQHSYIHVIKLSDGRSLKEIIEGMIVQNFKATMKIDVVLLFDFVYCDSGRNRLRCRGVLFGSNDQVDIAVRPQSGFGIQPGHCPSLHEDRFNSFAIEKTKDTLYGMLTDESSRAVKSVGFLEL